MEQVFLQNLLRGASLGTLFGRVSQNGKKKGGSKQIFTALFTQLLLKYARFFLSLDETQVKDRIFEISCIQLVSFLR